MTLVTHRVIVDTNQQLYVAILGFLDDEVSVFMPVFLNSLLFYFVAIFHMYMYFLAEKKHIWSGIVFMTDNFNKKMLLSHEKVCIYHTCDLSYAIYYYYFEIIQLLLLLLLLLQSLSYITITIAINYSPIYYYYYNYYYYNL